MQIGTYSLKFLGITNFEFGPTSIITVGTIKYSSIGK